MPLHARRDCIGVARAAPRNAEFRLRRAGRDLGVRLRIDIGIDADGDRRALVRRERDLVQRFELRFALDIELMDAGIEAQVASRLSSCRRRRRRCARRQIPAASAFFISPPETTSAPAPSRASVFSTARLPFALTENAISVSFGKRRREDTIMPFQRRGRIAVERRADLFGERCEIDILGMKDAIPIGEMVHSPIGLGGLEGSF